jgi:hypothetical protein
VADIAKTMAVKNGSVAFTPTAGAASQTIVVGKDERTGIYVKNGSAAPINVTVKKGNGICSVDGDLVVAVAAGAERIIGPLESARFIDTTTGKITVELSATATVTIGVIQL